MTKAADALRAAGHEIRVVSTRHTPWAKKADEDMRRGRGWQWRVVDYSRESGGLTYWKSGIRGRLSEAFVQMAGVSRVPFKVGVHAYARVHTELVAAALEQRADLFYGGTTGALAATAEAAARSSVPFGLDLEDFHAEELPEPEGRMQNALSRRILQRVVPGAAFLTTSSRQMGEEYARSFGAAPITVNNTFPLPVEAPSIVSRGDGPLKGYWFSQTVAAGRGIEDFLAGAALADVPIELHLRGRAVAGYIDELSRFAARIAPRVSIVVSEPAPPDAMISLCGNHDFGLAVEEGDVLSRRLALTNKALTYILAGLAVILTDTEAQRDFAGELGEGALLYRQGDHRALAAGLKRWYCQPERLLAARQAAWRAAVSRWHWEHPSQSGALVHAVEGALA
ncbi:MAG TPA: glycosyltransferase [Vicinamibacterales bacterium]|nr:glycosyltransferase [Vicinamibacterales bacterium]